MTNDWPVAITASVIFGGWVVPAVAKHLATNWRLAKESEHLAILKQQMLERGMSVEEIERVANAGLQRNPNVM